MKGLEQIQSPEMRAERLRHPSELRRSSRKKSQGRSWFVFVPSVAALLLAIGLTFSLVQMGEEYEVRETRLNDRIAELTSSLGLTTDRLDQEHQRVGSLSAEVELVQKRLGLSHSEIARTRVLAEEIRRHHG